MISIFQKLLKLILCYRSDKKTCILKSVEGTSYYDDKLDDIEHPQYTLYGQVGDQDENHNFNKNLLNSIRTEKIYLFQRTKTQWIWFGRYTIKSKLFKTHPDKENNLRQIIVLQLQKYNPDHIHDHIQLPSIRKTIQLSTIDQLLITPKIKISRH